jgi:hypothetical protein
MSVTAVNKRCRFIFEVQMISDVANEPRMGRPPLNRDDVTKRTQVRFEAEMMARIDAIAGPHRRAEFIREAVERELERRESSAVKSR